MISAKPVCDTGHAGFLTNGLVVDVGGEFILEGPGDFLGALNSAGFLSMAGPTAVGIGTVQVALIFAPRLRSAAVTSVAAVTNRVAASG